MPKIGKKSLASHEEQRRQHQPELQQSLADVEAQRAPFLDFLFVVFSVGFLAQFLGVVRVLVARRFQFARRRFALGGVGLQCREQAQCHLIGALAGLFCLVVGP